MCELCNDKDLDKIREKYLEGVTEQELKKMIEKTKYNAKLNSGWHVESILYPMFR